MNTELLLKVKAAILADPLKFDMCAFFTADESSPCGTTACIAGHAVAIDSGELDLSKWNQFSSYHFKGQSVLGLDDGQSNRLFYSEAWPRELYDRYIDASEASNRPLVASISAERIDHFIATNGED